MIRLLRLAAVAVLAVVLGGCRKPVTFGAWISEWHPDVSILKEHPELFDSVSFSWFGINDDGSLKRGAPAGREEVVKWARDRGIRVWATIGGGVPGITGAAGDKAVGGLVAACAEIGFDGIDVDIEGLPGSAREVYTAFITKLAAGLRAMNPPRRLSVTLAEIQDPKVAAGSFADYALMGRIADEVRIMCYDVSYTEPGPIMDRESFAADLQFARSVIPAGKLVIAVPWYGRDWDTTAKTHQDILWRMTNEADGISGMDELLARHGGAPVWREPEGELSYSYTADGHAHEVWMADARQFEWMVKAARKAGASGIYVWQLEYAGPSFAPAVRREVER